MTPARHFTAGTAVTKEEYDAILRKAKGNVSAYIRGLLALEISEDQLTALKARAASHWMTLADFVRAALEIGSAEMPETEQRQPAKR